MLAARTVGQLLDDYSDVATPATLVVVVVVVGAGLWLTLWLRASFREDTDHADRKLELLSQFRELHEQGDLSEDEYRLIKSRLAQEAVTLVGSSPGITPSADSARSGKQDEETEKAGESVRNGTFSEKSSSSTEPPNEIPKA